MFWTRILGGSLFGLAVIVFLSFVVTSLVLGGDAINGKVEGDRYFLGSHGKYVEVSEGVYRYSRTHGIMVIVTFPLGVFVGGFLLSRADRLERKRIVAWLGERPPLTAAQFAERYFGPDPRRVELAARLRDILEKETGIAMAGLLPDDRLGELSRSIAAGEPFLYMEIEDRLEVDTGVMDYARRAENLERIRTFRDLVDYVASCPKKARIEEEKPPEEPPRGPFVQALERWLWLAFGKGWIPLSILVVGAIVAGLLAWPAAVYVFLGAAVSGFGLALVGLGLWLWLLAVAALRARLKSGQTVGAGFSLVIWGFAGTFVAWCGIGAMWGFFSNWPL